MTDGRGAFERFQSVAHRLAGDDRSLPDEGRLASFDRATGWLNTDPLASEPLRGRVVLVDFWTYTCVNWLRTLPYLRAWHEKYAAAGLTIVGVHTPSSASRPIHGTSTLTRVPSRSTIRSPSTPTTASGTSSRTATGPRSISPTPRGASVSTTSARGSTS